MVFDDVPRRLRRSWLDHHSRLRAEYPCRLQNAADVSPLLRQLDTRAAHSLAFAMPMIVRLPSSRHHTAP